MHILRIAENAVVRQIIKYLRRESRIIVKRKKKYNTNI
jgi:hypothetical protein